MYLAAVRSLGVAGLVVSSWSAEKISTSGASLEGVAAIITSVGGIIAILVSAWLQVRAKKPDDSVKDELIDKLLEQLLEAKKPDPPRKAARRRKPKEES